MTVAQNTKITVNTTQAKGTISRHIYGHFAEHLGRCIYEGMWVGEDSSIPEYARHSQRCDCGAAAHSAFPCCAGRAAVLRTNTIGKMALARVRSGAAPSTPTGAASSKTIILARHEFLELCDLLDCEPYIAGNVGSGTMQEMQHWIEYMTFAGDLDGGSGDVKMGGKHRGGSNISAWATRTGVVAAICARNIMPTNIAATKPMCAILATTRFTESPVAPAISTTIGQKCSCTRGCPLHEWSERALLYDSPYLGA